MATPVVIIAVGGAQNTQRPINRPTDQLPSSHKAGETRRRPVNLAVFHRPGLDEIHLRAFPSRLTGFVRFYHIIFCLSDLKEVKIGRFVFQQ